MTPGWLLLVAGTGLVAGIFSAFKSPRVWLAATLAGAVAAFAAAVWMLATGAVWDWQPDFVSVANRLHLRLDGLSAFFLVLLSVVGGAGTLYSQRVLVGQKSSGFRAEWAARGGTGCCSTWVSCCCAPTACIFSSPGNCSPSARIS